MCTIHCYPLHSNIRAEIPLKKKAFQSQINRPLNNRLGKGGDPQVNKYEQVGVPKWTSVNMWGGRLQVNKFEQNLSNGVPRAQKDMSENITFPQTTYAGGN